MNLLYIIRILLINIGVLQNQQKPKHDLHRKEEKRFRFNNTNHKSTNFFNITEWSPVKLFILIVLISIIMTICAYLIIPPIESGVYYRFTSL